MAFGQSVAREYGPRDIRCNIVLPGFLETKFVGKLTPGRIEAIRAEHALGRFNTVENAARFIAFLARLDHVSGQVFTLDSRIDRWT
jgi:3-oxoacyl-[acyl-carrier protein] reductase